MSEERLGPAEARSGPLIHCRKRRATDALADGPDTLARGNRVARNINVADGVRRNGGGAGIIQPASHCKTIRRRPGHPTVGASADYPSVRHNDVDVAEQS